MGSSSFYNIIGEDMDTYFAVGVPAGALNDDDDYRYFYMAGNILGIKHITYRIWSYFQGGSTVENVISNPEFSVYNDPKGLQEIINEMIRAGLIIPRNRLEKYILLRHGIGAGYQKDGSYLIYTDHPINVSQLSYIIWLFSDGHNTFKDIQRRLRMLDVEASEQEIKEAVILLFAESILFLSQEA
jgi:hypothetical protein